MGHRSSEDKVKKEASCLVQTFSTFGGTGLIAVRFMLNYFTVFLSFFLCSILPSLRTAKHSVSFNFFVGGVIVC